jgi:hypothetical protein
VPLGEVVGHVLQLTSLLTNRRKAGAEAPRDAPPVGANGPAQALHVDGDMPAS